jgi:hypothetical protein
MRLVFNPFGGFGSAMFARIMLPIGVTLSG